MNHKDTAGPTATFNQFDPLAALHDLIAIDQPELRNEATEQWFIVFSPWINAVARKARLAHSQHVSGISDHEIDDLTRNIVINIVMDCQNHPEKAEYIGSLEKAVLDQVDHQIARRQDQRGITPQTVSGVKPRGSDLENVRHSLAMQLGRPPTRSEIVAAWSQRRAENS